MSTRLGGHPPRLLRLIENAVSLDYFVSVRASKRDRLPRQNDLPVRLQRVACL